MLAVTIASSVLVILTACFAVSRVLSPVIKRIKEIGKNLDNFIEDWHGTAARDGRRAVPGVMQRLNNIDGQLTHNGGSSIKDSVDRIESGIIEINHRLEEGDKKFDEIEDRLEDI
tara:strand:- start:92 stop:436 length:345 start_codon:yes stop_codon:yes gene_type:complete